jgi:transcriptional regulator with XRE-family HTH domain
MILKTHCLAGLRSIREQRGIEASELAAAIGVNLSSYYRFERGERRIYFDKAVLLARQLDCSLHDFLVDRPGATITAPPAAPTPDAAEILENWEA